MKSTLPDEEKYEEYLKYRPPYPESIISLVQKEVHFDEFKDVAIIESGIGALSKLFAKNGNITFAVEPTEELRQKAEKSAGKYMNLINMKGDAKATNLADRSVDIILIADALQRPDLIKEKNEFCRIIRKDGYCLIAYQILKSNTPFMKEFNKLMREPIFQEVLNDKDFENKIEKFYEPNKSKVRTIEYNHDISSASLKGLAMSYLKMPSDSNCHKKIINGLKTLFEKNNLSGNITLEYKIKIHIGKI